MKPVLLSLFTISFILNSSCHPVVVTDDSEILFDGSSLDAWEFRPKGWFIDQDGALSCRMEDVQDKNGKTHSRSMGNIMSKKEYRNFELALDYKLSDAANSGIFYWADKNDPVRKGFEIQLMDNEGFQREHGPRDDRKLNGSFYDGKAPLANPAHPTGQWDHLILRCQGSNVRVTINGIEVVDVDVSQWTTPGKNPDGTSNKFKDALALRPRKGHIGLQNHGQKVWFKDISIRKL